MMDRCEHLQASRSNAGSKSFKIEREVLMHMFGFYITTAVVLSPDNAHVTTNTITNVIYVIFLIGILWSSKTAVQASSHLKPIQSWILYNSSRDYRFRSS